MADTPNDAVDMHRGHRIVEIRKGRWVYADTIVLVSKNPDRPCGKCGRANTPAGHDACIADLPGVANACCGHGRHSDAYVQFEDGRRLEGMRALEKMARLKASLITPHRPTEAE